MPYPTQQFHLVGLETHSGSPSGPQSSATQLIGDVVRRDPNLGGEPLDGGHESRPM